MAHALGAAAAAATSVTGPAATPAAAARALSGREGVDLVIETAGTPEAVGQALELARPGGRIVLTGLPHAALRVEFFWVVRRELSILGSMIYQTEFPEAIRLLAAGGCGRSGCSRIASRSPTAHDAFHAHRAPESIKIAVIP